MVATKSLSGFCLWARILEGYNTLDALASVAFSVIAVTTLNHLGFSSKKEYIKTIWLVGIVVALGFSVLYIGLGFLGNHFPIPLLLWHLIPIKGCMYYQKQPKRSFGPTAQIFLAGMVTVTCFYHNRWFNRLYQ